MKNEPIVLRTEQWNHKKLVVGKAYLLYDKDNMVGQHVMLRKIRNGSHPSLEFIYPVWDDKVKVKSIFIGSSEDQLNMFLIFPLEENIDEELIYNA